MTKKKRLTNFDAELYRISEQLGVSLEGLKRLAVMEYLQNHFPQLNNGSGFLSLQKKALANSSSPVHAKINQNEDVQ